MADNLPQIMSDTLEESKKSNEAVLAAQLQMKNVLKGMDSSFARSAQSLNDFAKHQMGKLNPFSKLKKGFDESFIGQKRARKKEEETLAEKAGITREELLLLKADKELKDAQKAQAEQLEQTLKQYGLETTAYFDKAGELQTSFDRDEKGRFAQSAKTIVNGIVASMEDGNMQDIENRREQARRDEEQTTLMASLVGGIKDLGDSLLKGLKGLGDKGAGGLGIFAGLLAAPFMILSGFFGQLKAEFKILDSLTKGKLFEPFKRFGNWIKGLGTKFKGMAFDKFGKVLDPISDTLTKGKKFFKDIGTKVKGIFGQGGKFASIGKAFSGGFGTVGKFASGAGKLLGKLFLPVTVIMGIIDGVKGFMEGFSEEGILGGLFGAVEGVLTGLVAIPLDLLKSGVSWVAEKMGFENFSKMLDSFSFEGLFDNIFNGLQDLRTAITDKVSDFWAGTKSFFGFGESEEEKAERLNKRAERDALIEKNRLEKKAKIEGITVEELKKRIEGQGTESGGSKGAQVNAQSGQAANASGQVVVTTVSPTNINASTSNSVSNQTNVTPTATRVRGPKNNRRNTAYA